MEKRRIAILGSTGSIGTQALDSIRQNSECFEVELLTANTSAELLISQAIEFRPNAVVICDESRYEQVRNALEDYDIKVWTGIDAVCDILRGDNIDIVLTAMVGFSGLRPTMAAIESGKVIALANKETLVAAGKLVTEAARRYNAAIIPVDSEHSAIFQCLQGERSRIEKILLTGSGGPFRKASKDDIYNATPAQALNHPRWKMGAKVTIDSASLMNKGLELIEARWLFNMPASDIQVVIHPQSIIHSMVQFEDGSVIAQMGNPDMRIPIQYAFSYPYRLPLNSQRLDFAELAQMTFEKPDLERFPCLQLAYDSLEKGGNAACVMNAANEEAVASFLQQRIPFGKIPEVISETMAKCPFQSDPDLNTIFETNIEARQIAKELIW